MLQLEHHYSQLSSPFFSYGQIKPLKGLRLSFTNHALASQLGIDFTHTETLDIFLGKTPLKNALSMVYAGHQFGGFSPQLGDGRGLLLGEVKDNKNNLIDLHMKGVGPTPYARQGDGRAVLRSSIREYLASEAMYHLGVASTRALALFDSEEIIYREGAEPAAMLLRGACTHIRFGHFEYFFYQKKTKELDELIDYCIKRHFRSMASRTQSIINMLEKIVESTAKMVAHWQAVGFQHGVMNTDNMSILGETLDYGPYGFMEAYDPKWVANESDYNARYAFEKQPAVALWNLNHLFVCFSKHLSKTQLIEILSRFEPCLINHFQALISAKLGLKEKHKDDLTLFSNLLVLLEKEKIDYTNFWRNLSQMQDADDKAHLILMFANRLDFEAWLASYIKRRSLEDSIWSQVRLEMLQTNPKYILRNYLAQRVIEAAENKDYRAFEALIKVLEAPFEEHEDCAHLAIPTNTEQKSFCVSCSS